jgi:pimeloyl-ACP methyl ester carboxylesterase
VTALAAGGHHVLYVNPRYRGNDSALIMEKCISDLAAALRHARDRLGYEQFILGGWSGGGSMSLFYQDQAENPTITHTPAGDAYDLTAIEMPKVDGIMLLAAHISRAMTLTEWIDPSILDENAPFVRDPELNIYDPANPHQPPYDDAYVARCRTAQIARNRRITAWVKNELAAIRGGDTPHAERAFVVHGTMADVRWTDPSQDPSDRRPYECYLGVPKVANDGPVGLARFSTLRSWLSQWSIDDHRADSLKNGASVSVPFLAIECGADDAVPQPHTRMILDAVASRDKSMHVVDGANH